MPDSPPPGITARQPRAIHSALTVLEAVAELGAGVSARELSAALGLPRATTYRLLNLLVQDEYLVRTPDLTGFALGQKVVGLAAAAVPVRLTRAARTVLDDLRSGARGGIHLVLFVDGRLVVADSDPDFPLADPHRAARELETTALGCLLLVERGAALPPTTAAVSTRGTLRRIEGTSGCLATPIRDGAGDLVGGLAYSGTRARIEAPRDLTVVLEHAAGELAPLVS
ncbi:helix-turn-helix domain-containing protein [Microbacterium sp. NPDC080220]|uniref:helix-turn-helix domain-containing protein n=1 Tax=Microbacterium sp. NPDC080220 TaxID=3161017 RepID=UPI00343763FB